MPDALADLERARLAAIVAGDIEAMQRFHHPDFQLITPRGVSLSLGEYVHEIASGGLRYLRWIPEAIEVRRSADCAVLRYRAEIEMLSDGVVLPIFRTWHTDLYEHRDGRWAVVWSQATQVA